MKSLLKSLLATSRYLWLILGVTLALLVVAEGGARVWLSFSNDGDDYSRAKFRAHKFSRAEVYKDAEWVHDFYQETNASWGMDWHPYVYWRRQSKAGEYINIDRFGRRKTWNPKPTQDARTVFVFGGSTTWGTGVRQDFTLPSQISRELAKQNIAAQVTNFGESGYVSTQEVISLLRELQNENVPDIVIFYDGVNDVYSARQNKHAGIPLNEINRIREFNFEKRIDTEEFQHEVANRYFMQMLSKLKIVQLGQRWFGKKLYNKKDWGFKDELNEKFKLPESEVAKLNGLDDSPKSVAQVYRTNMRFVNALAEKYNFKAFFVWQPIIFQKKQLSPYETEMAEKMKDWSDYYLSTYLEVKKTLAMEPNFIYLADELNEMKDPFYLDFCHISERGNELMAKRIVEEMTPLQ